jgi:hypothetical protein
MAPGSKERGRIQNSNILFKGTAPVTIMLHLLKVPPPLGKGTKPLTHTPLEDIQNLKYHRREEVCLLHGRQIKCILETGNSNHTGGPGLRGQT